MSEPVAKSKIFVTQPTANYCARLLHAFTGQPLPNDEDLMKDRADEIPEAARQKCVSWE